MLPMAALWQYLVTLQDSKLQITKGISETTPSYSLRLHLLEVVDGGRGGPRLHSNQGEATLRGVVGHIHQAPTPVISEAILSGFREARPLVIGSDAEGHSEDRLTEDDTVLRLPPELLE